MGTKNITVVKSDLSGEPGAETTLIGLRREVMELDLTSEERRTMDRVFAPTSPRRAVSVR